jgi:2-C-methyl-D-erythritol 4-phosphate cytidylyltransferase
VKVCAILLCAGQGRRLGAGIAKALAPLAGRPLFAWPLATLQHCAAIHGVVVVGPVKPMREASLAAGLPADKIVAWVDGGRERHESVARGLAAVPAEFGLVAVHDCARALVSAALVSRVVADAMAHGAAIAAVPLDDTLKRATLGVVDDTVPREGLWRAQTPQVFRRDWLEEAHRTKASGATDDAALVEALGRRVHLSEGESLNIKITSPADLAVAEAWIEAESARNDTRR